MKVDEDNVKAVAMVNGRYEKFWRFSSNEFCRNIGCLFLDPTFGIGGSRLWEKEEAQNISGKKRTRRSTRMKIYLYEVCLPIIIHCLLFYFMTTPTPFLLPPYFWYLSHQGNGVQEVLAKRIRVGRR